MTKSIYLDYAATTPVEPSVLADMIPFFSDNFGNPSSVHQIGQAAESFSPAAAQRATIWLYGALPMLQGINAAEIIF